MTDQFAPDPNVIFTTDLYKGISRMRDNLSLVLAPELETSELECLADVLFEFCEELFAELFNYSHEMIVLHEMDILYWRRRTIFQNENIASIREFLLEQFYESLPTYPTHCTNIILVHDLRYLTPYFYLKRPVPSLEVKRSVKSTLDRTKLNKDDNCYILSQSWYETWSSSEDSSALPPINNSVYIDPSRLDAINCEGTSFVDVPEWVWHHLLAWYGITNCLLGIKRFVMDSDYAETVVMRTPEDIWCFLFPNTNEFRIIKVLDSKNVSEITQKMKSIYSVPPQRDIQLYTSQMQYDQWKLLDYLKPELTSCVMLVLRKENGAWPDVAKECDF